MSYVISVGGDPINPNPFTYSQISMTGNISLVWPSNNHNSTYTATNWIDIMSSAAYVATMPDATEVGEGQEVVFNNYGSFTIAINNSTGGNITTVATGQAKRVWVTDNSTPAGVWRVSNIGSGTTNADASALAGYGLIAQAGQLSQSMPPTSYSTNSTLNAGNRAYLSIWTGGSGTLTLTSPATLGSNWFTNIKNFGSGSLTIDGNGANIDGSPTITVGLNEGFTLETDGVQFYTVGRLTPGTSGVTQLNKSVAGSGSVTLSNTEAAYSIINFTGILTGNKTVVVPNNVNEWLMYNATTGAFSLTVKTSAGMGIVITQGARRLTYSDGTDVFFSDSVGSGTVTSIDTGTGLTGGPVTTTGTISLANTAVTAGSYGSASRIPIYTTNAQGQFTSSTDTPVSITDANLSSAVGVAKGGTGLTTSGTSGNVLTSNGTAWVSSPVAAGNLTGPITSVGLATSIANNINLPGSPTTTTQSIGDNSTKIATTAFVLANSGLTKILTSVGNSFTANGTNTIAHGFGVKPFLVNLSIVNTTAESGYSIGDELIIGTVIFAAASSFAPEGALVTIDSTNINVKWSALPLNNLPNKSTFASSSGTPANWTLTVRAAA